MKQAKRYSKALAGLSGVIVWVHEPHRTTQQAGISRQHLQDDAVIRLLDAGIRALGIGNVPEPPGNPWLNIFVAAHKMNGAYFFSVTVRLDEIVWLERNRSCKTIGTTWESDFAGVAEESELPAKIERGMDDLIDYFIYDYRVANPRT